MQVMDMVTHPHNAHIAWTLQLDVGKKQLLDTETDIFRHEFKLIGCIGSYSPKKQLLLILVRAIKVTFYGGTKTFSFRTSCMFLSLQSTGTDEE